MPLYLAISNLAKILYLGEFIVFLSYPHITLTGWEEDASILRVSTTERFVMVARQYITFIGKVAVGNERVII